MNKFAVVTLIAVWVLGVTDAGAAPRRTRDLLTKPNDELAAACKKRDHVACMTLVIKEVRDHLDDPAQVAKAKKTFEDACNARVWEGCAQLGEMYAFGKPSDMAKAKAMLDKACANKDPLGCSDLGTMYQNGIGVAKDEKKAVGLYQKGCNNGLVIACVNLGFMYSQGKGAKQDLGKALALYTKACDADEAKGCMNLGAVYQNGNAKVAPDRIMSTKYFVRACKLGDQQGCEFAKH